MKGSTFGPETFTPGLGSEADGEDDEGESRRTVKGKKRFRSLSADCVIGVACSVYSITHLTQCSWERYCYLCLTVSELRHREFKKCPESTLFTLSDGFS